ncbi:hypothetical protein [Lentzea albida]|uniref:hypothetical protein n=1 Tax=Lentzea albida TaxID=65499 RepID=UPI0011609BDB|nr:hypothetical protein [Lentzea albida]
MDGFEESLRVGQAQEAVRLAVAQEDVYAAEVHGADLANLRRLAGWHGVVVDPPEEGRARRTSCWPSSARTPRESRPAGRGGLGHRHTLETSSQA